MQTHNLVINMADKKLRAEAAKRSIVFVSMDDVKTLASSLRVHDRLMANPETKLSGIEDYGVSNLSFQQRLELQEQQLAMLYLLRKIKQKKGGGEAESTGRGREVA